MKGLLIAAGQRAASGSLLDLSALARGVSPHGHFPGNPKGFGECGNQSGEGRAGLDAAIRYGFPHGGWCPKGRKAEDGPIGGQYNLFETPSASYLQRTELNVRDSDATAIFTLAVAVTGGSLRTIGFAEKHRKPWVHIAARAGTCQDPVLALREFVEGHGKRKMMRCCAPTLHRCRSRRRRRPWRARSSVSPAPRNAGLAISSCSRASRGPGSAPGAARTRRCPWPPCGQFRRANSRTITINRAAGCDW